MGLVVDTCIFIQAERQGNADYLETLEDQRKRLYKCGDYFGITHWCSSGRYRCTTYAARSAFVEAIISEMPALDFTPEVARLHAELYLHLSKQGQLIGADDLIIAATTIVHDYTLWTYNHQEFERVPGLK